MFISPYDERELAGDTLVEGEATGCIDEAIIGKSKSSGDLMITLNNKIWDINENELLIKDYIPLTEKMRWKLAQVFKAINKTDKLKEGFESLDIPRLLKDCAFKCIIKLEDSNNNDGKKFMKIKRYLEPFTTEQQPNSDPFSEDFDKSNVNQAAKEFFGS